MCAYLLTYHSLKQNRVTVHIPTDTLLKMKVCRKECEQSFSFFLSHTYSPSQHACKYILIVSMHCRQTPHTQAGTVKYADKLKCESKSR